MFFDLAILFALTLILATLVASFVLLKQSHRRFETLIAEAFRRASSQATQESFDEVLKRVLPEINRFTQAPVVPPPVQTSTPTPAPNGPKFRGNFGNGTRFSAETFDPEFFNRAGFPPTIFNSSFNPSSVDSMTFYPGFTGFNGFDPAYLNPALFNPAVFNPALLNPALFSPAFFKNGGFNPFTFNPTNGRSNSTFDRFSGAAFPEASGFDGPFPNSPRVAPRGDFPLGYAPAAPGTSFQHAPVVVSSPTFNAAKDVPAEKHSTASPFFVDSAPNPGRGAHLVRERKFNPVVSAPPSSFNPDFPAGGDFDPAFDAIPVVAPPASFAQGVPFQQRAQLVPE